MSERDVRHAGAETSRRRKRNDRSFHEEKHDPRTVFFDGEISGYDGRDWTPRVESTWIPPKSDDIKVDRIMFEWAFHNQKASMVKPSAYGSSGHDGDPDDEESHYCGRVEIVIRREGIFNKCAMPSIDYSDCLRNTLYLLYRDGAPDDLLESVWSNALYAKKSFGAALKIDISANPFIRISHHHTGFVSDK